VRLEGADRDASTRFPGDAGHVVIVRSGWWLYDGIVERRVDVVGLPYDFFFELAKADGQLEPDEVALDPDVHGLLYYVRFRYAGETTTPTWPDSGGKTDVEAAMREAESRVPSAVRWDPVVG
jgi:hypothetical protein